MSSNLPPDLINFSFILMVLGIVLRDENDTDRRIG